MEDLHFGWVVQYWPQSVANLLLQLDQVDDKVLRPSWDLHQAGQTLVWPLGMCFQIDGDFMHLCITQMWNELLQLFRVFNVKEWRRLKKVVLLRSNWNCLAEIKSVVKCFNLKFIRMRKWNLVGLGLMPTSHDFCLPMLLRIQSHLSYCLQSIRLLLEIGDEGIIAIVYRLPPRMLWLPHGVISLINSFIFDYFWHYLIPFILVEFPFVIINCVICLLQQVFMCLLDIVLVKILYPFTYSLAIIA